MQLHRIWIEEFGAGAEKSGIAAMPRFALSEAQSRGGPVQRPLLG